MVIVWFRSLYNVVFVVVCLWGLIAAGCVEDVEPAELSARLDALGATACPGLGDEYRCVSLEVPLDHSAPDGDTINAAFAVRLASGSPEEHLGMLVTANGGPGYSGIAWAEDFAAVDAVIARRFDLVFFDLRGLFASGGLDCPVAANAWFVADWRADGPEAALDVGAAAAAFSRDCIEELALPESELRFYNTAQAIADLDALRAATGQEQLTLYGLSYGTQFMQAYATAYPTHTRALLIDGVVDMTLSGLAYAEQVTRTHNDVLARVIEACANDAACAEAFDGDPAAGFDAVAAALQSAPATVAYRIDGEEQARRFTRADLDRVAAIALANAQGRTAMMRAVAAAFAGDYAPLLDELYVTWIEARTLDSLKDATYADAGYYMFTCNDYGRVAGVEVSNQQAAWLDAVVRLSGEPGQRVLQAFGGDLPCTTWASAPIEPERPAPYAASSPTMFINADADIATPFAQGDGIYRRLVEAAASVAAIRVPGGHHVMLGSDDCVDARATAFLLDPTVTADGSETICPVRLMEPF
jgi:pimeloyl-ACP methyl ester carboxylesterase